MNLEARSVGGWGTSRHCVVTRLEDITADQFQEICTKAGALLVMLPRHISRLLEDEKQVTSYSERECTTCVGLLNSWRHIIKVSLRMLPVTED